MSNSVICLSALKEKAHINVSSLESENEKIDC